MDLDVKKAHLRELEALEDVWALLSVSIITEGTGNMLSISDKQNHCMAWALTNVMAPSITFSLI